MKSRALIVAGLSVAAAACTGEGADDGAVAAESGIEISTRGLWAGSVGAKIERYGDACSGARAMGDEPVVYDSWARQRASVRNICFEIWKPGATNTDNPDYWRLLDVQVHYRYAGQDTEWKQAYVSSVGRRGNNRVYAWNLGIELDPMFMAGAISDIRAPFEVLQENEQTFTARADLEFYFTVNGHELTPPNRDRFRVAYMDYRAKPPLHQGSGPAVLGATVECASGALRAGWGAGYYAVDIHDQEAADLLTRGYDGSKIYALSLATSGERPTRIVSLAMSSGMPDAFGLPHYVAGAFAPSVHAELRPEAEGKMTVMVKAWDRATKKIEDVSVTFDGCVRK